MKSLEGMLLVASPHLQGSAFSRSVVFVLHHDENGAFGVVLNRPVTQAVSESLQESGLDVAQANVRVNLGGPQMNSILAIQQSPTGMTPCMDRGSCEAVLRQAAKSSGGPAVRVFVGHAGWSSEQLDAEVASGLWMTTAATPDHVFGEHEDLWATTVRQIGRSVLHESLGITGFPADPSVN